MDVRDTLWTFLVQGEGLPRRQIRVCASLQERLEKKANQRRAPVREPRIAQVNLSVHWRKPEVPQWSLIPIGFGRQGETMELLYMVLFLHRNNYITQCSLQLITGWIRATEQKSLG